jgi:hypothetical protein
MMQMPAATKKGGMAQATPDVCHVPAPPPPGGPGGIPTPFPNMASLSGCDKTVDKVLVEKKETIVEDSKVPSTKGDESGVSNLPTPKGLVSQSNLGECDFKKYSSKVYFKGKKAVHHTAATTHNGSNPNMPAGIHSTASQQKVKVAT